MDVLFLGSFFPGELHDEIVANSFGPIATANNTLQFALLKGLSQFYASIHAVTLPNIGAFPRRYNQAFFPPVTASISPNIEVKSLGFFNLVGLKHYSRYRAVKRELHRRLRLSNGEAIIFVYDLHPPFLVAVSEVKRAFPRLTVCAIVPDLPGFTSESTSLLHSSFLKLEKRLLDLSYMAVDGYVVLSKHMVEKLPLNGKPWVVVEGIFDSGYDQQSPVFSEQSGKTIFYAGSLDRRNGVMRLVRAFRQIQGDEFRLVLCGSGDTEAEIRHAAADDPRIDFKGQVTRSEALAFQKTSTLLVNPRTPEGEFTRYSFPSKTMEYLASSVPLLMHRLEGVPDEYFNHAYVLDDLSSDALAEEIVRICNIESSVVEKRTVAARKFVFEEKNPTVQCKKIVALANQLTNEDTSRI